MLLYSFGQKNCSLDMIPLASATAVDAEQNWFHNAVAVKAVYDKLRTKYFLVELRVPFKACSCKFIALIDEWL